MPRPALLRDRDRDASSGADVSTTELFFDLVYVFTFIQLSEFLYDHLDAAGLLQVAVMFLAVWWAWNYTAWATNWLDAGRAGPTVLVAVLMVFGLLMASAIPDAFRAGHDRAFTFAAAYVAMQLLRGAAMVWAFGPGLRDRMARNYAQLLAWCALTAPLWLAGGVVGSEPARLALWGAGIVIDFAAPLVGFWLPRAGATPIASWTIAGEHLAERCHLVLMIAFGESVLRLGESFADAAGKPGAVSSFLVGFVLVFALWAAYFLGQAEHGMARMGTADESAARIGRSGYTYAHAVMVGGVLMTAVLVHLAIEHPGKHVTLIVGAIGLLGPTLYLLGMAAYLASVGTGDALTPAAAVLVTVVVGIAGAQVSRLGELVAVTLVAAGVSLLTLRHRLRELLQGARGVPGSS